MTYHRLSIGEVEGDVVEVSASRTHLMAVTSHGLIVHWPGHNQLDTEGRGMNEDLRNVVFFVLFVLFSGQQCCNLRINSRNYVDPEFTSRNYQYTGILRLN